jgi:hypothetical protein
MIEPTFHQKLVELIGSSAAKNIQSLAELISTYGYLWVLNHVTSLLH